MQKARVKFEWCARVRVVLGRIHVCARNGPRRRRSIVARDRHSRARQLASLARLCIALRTYVVRRKSPQSPGQNLPRVIDTAAKRLARWCRLLHPPAVSLSPDARRFSLSLSRSFTATAWLVSSLSLSRALSGISPIGDSYCRPSSLTRHEHCSTAVSRTRHTLPPRSPSVPQSRETCRARA